MKQLSTLVVVNLFAANVFASPVCTSGPECPELQNVIDQIKTLKEKRHEDVKNFGRNSSEVKADDQAISRAMLQDKDFRDARQVEGGDEKPGFQRSRRRHVRKGVGT